MDRSRRLSPFLQDVVTTSAVTVLVAGMSGLQIKLLAQYLGPHDFGLYSVARRLLYLLSPLATLMMGIALPRYLARPPDRADSKALILAASAISILMSLVVGAIVAHPSFHPSGVNMTYSAGIIAIFLGNAIWVVTYGTFRGSGQVTQANALHLWSLGIAPLLVAAFASREGVATTLVWMGVGQIVLLPLLFPPVLRASSRPLPGGALVLARFGASRIPGHFAFALLLSGASVLASIIGSEESAGYISIGTWLVSAVEAAVVGLALASLPRAARLVAEERHTYIGSTAWSLVAFVLHASLFVAAQLVVSADRVVTAWLGSGFEAAAPYLAVAALSLPAFAVFMSLRSVIDAIDDRAINTAHTTLGVVVAGLASIPLVLQIGPLGLMYATTVGITTSGFLTIYYLYQRFDLALGDLLLGTSLTSTTVLALGTLVVLHSTENLSSSRQAATHIGWVALAATGYGLLLLRRNATWIEELKVRTRKTHGNPT